ncbi:hypothetical protein [Clostridium hydrogenum]|uniref:hypothetical protein n=1 Tax=Clostridium hydrogenum TaxID=2855764 RepID=UPI001F38D1CE|nr:hypothetical protein [Clostridium hydrogenum]
MKNNVIYVDFFNKTRVGKSNNVFTKLLNFIKTTLRIKKRSFKPSGNQFSNTRSKNKNIL